MKVDDVLNNSDFIKWLSDYYDGKVIKGRQEQISDFLKEQGLDTDELQKVLYRFRRDYTQASYPACGVIEKMTEEVTAYSSRKTKFKPRKEAIAFVQHPNRNYGPREVYKLCKLIRQDMKNLEGNALAQSILWVFDDFVHNADARSDAGMERDVIAELAQRDLEATIHGEEIEDAVKDLKIIKDPGRMKKVMPVEELVNKVFPPVEVSKSMFV